jgi:hypothetical protein
MFDKKNHLQNKYLVYTSAGDRSNLRYWLKGKRNFDLWVTYYGDEGEKYKDVADHYNKRKGGKFPNLHYVYREWPDRLASYDAIMVMDDDIIMSGGEISRLFELRARYDLWVCQPAYSLQGKHYHPITEVRPGNLLRYTNFVEVTCPVFLKGKLDDFMKVYDPVLIGLGVDWWFLHVFGPDLKGKVAVIDAVTCLNPQDEAKGGLREIDRLQPTSARTGVWFDIKKRYGISLDEQGQFEFGAVKVTEVEDRIFAFFRKYQCFFFRAKKFVMSRVCSFCAFLGLRRRIIWKLFLRVHGFPLGLRQEDSCLRPSAYEEIFKKIRRMDRPGPLTCVLLGGGVCSIILAVFLARLNKDAKVIFIDADGESVARLRRWIDEYHLHDLVVAHHVPYAPYEGQIWFDAGGIRDAVEGLRIDVLVVDAPHEGLCSCARKPAIPFFLPWLDQEACVFLHDMRCSDEMRTFVVWKEYFEEGVNFMTVRGIAVFCRKRPEVGRTS